MAVTPEKKAEAKAVYDRLVEHLHDIDLNFATEEREDRYVVRFDMNGDDIPMHFFLHVDANKQLLTLHSPMPVVFSADKIDLACKALCAINYRLSDGDFQLDIHDGEVLFNLSSSYAGSLVGNEVFDYILGLSISVVDEFNDKLLMLSKGMIDIDTILKDLNY